jgi:DNA-binding NtrC family response regulator
MRGTVLVVDDDVDSASLLAEILAVRDFTAEYAASAQECLDQLTRRIVDVVVTDLRMPEMSGIELCRVIRDLHPDVLVVAITGDLSRNAADEALAAGAYDYISKPIKVAMLDAVVGQASTLVQLRREVLRSREGSGSSIREEQPWPPAARVRERSRG